MWTKCTSGRGLYCQFKSCVASVQIMSSSHFISQLWQRCKFFWQTNNRQRTQSFLKLNLCHIISLTISYFCSAFTCEQEETKDHDACVAEIQKGWGWVFYVEFGKEVMNAVDSEVECGESAGHEAPPPPVVVLRAKVEVAEQDCGLRAGDDEVQEHEEQKSVPEY